MLRPVSEVADMETRFRYVDPVFQHSRRQYVGFVRDLVKNGSVGFVTTAVEKVGLSFVAKKAGAQRSIVDSSASNRHFSRPPSGPLPTGERLCHVEFQGALEDAQNWCVGSADIKNAFHQMRIPGWSQAFFIASEVVYTGKTIDRKRLAPDYLIYPVATSPLNGFFVGDVFLSRCHRPLHTRRKC